MGTPNKITRAKVIKCIDGTGGILTFIAKKVGVSRNALDMWINKPENLDIKPLLLAEKEKIIDVAEGGLFDLVAKKQEWAIKYLLGRKGKERGYGDDQKHELTGKDGGPIQTESVMIVKGLSKEVLEKLAEKL